MAENNCPQCGELATFQDKMGTLWDSNAHSWKPAALAGETRQVADRTLRNLAGQFMITKELHMKSKPIPVATVQDWLTEFGEQLTAAAESRIAQLQEEALIIATQNTEFTRRLGDALRRRDTAEAALTQAQQELKQQLANAAMFHERADDAEEKVEELRRSPTG